MLLAFALSFVKLCEHYERFFMLSKSRSRTHHPNMHYSYTGGRRKNMFSIQIHQKMFYSYTGSEQKHACQVFHPPNKCSITISQKFNCRKQAWAMQKLFRKKKKEKKRKNIYGKKWTQKCPRYLKQWVLRCLPEKGRQPLLSSKRFHVSKER